MLASPLPLPHPLRPPPLWKVRVLLRPKLKQEIKGQSFRINLPEERERIIHSIVLTSVWVCRCIKYFTSYDKSQRFFPLAALGFGENNGVPSLLPPLFLWVWRASLRESQECRLPAGCPVKQNSFTFNQRKPSLPDEAHFSSVGMVFSRELKGHRWEVVSEKQWHKRISRCGQILFSEKVRHKYVIWALDMHAKNVFLPQIMKHFGDRTVCWFG